MTTKDIFISMPRGNGKSLAEYTVQKNLYEALKEEAMGPSGINDFLSNLHFTFDVGVNKIPKVRRIIHSGPATIVFWEDGTKTVVKLSENDIYDEYAAFAAALAIKCYGSNSQVKKIIERKTVEQKETK